MQHKTAFINEDDTSVFFSGVFLYTATFPAAINLLPLGSVLVHAALAFGNSNLKNARFSRHEQDDRLYQSVPRLPWLYEEVSRVSLDTQKLLALEEVVPEVLVFALEDSRQGL